MKYKKSINIIACIVGVLSLAVYLTTMSRSVDFWDSGEFISTGSKLQVGHPPGAPFYQLLAALFSLFSFENPNLVAPLVNALSSVAAAACIVFLFFIIVRLLNRFSDKFVGNIIAAAIGSLTFAFTDSFWSSATETEVYSLSLLCSTVIFWAILKWDEKPSPKWWLFISLLFGLSIGIHTLTLLILPAVLLIVCFHYYKPSFYNILITLVISGLLIGLMFYFLPVLLYKNFLGAYIIIAVLIALLVISIWKHISLLNTIALSFIFFIIGISTYLVIMIRSDAGVPINEYTPKTSVQLTNYLQRRNYEKPPLIFGNQYTAYATAEYNVSDNGEIVPVYNKGMQNIFPRLWNPNYETGYLDWIGKPQKSVIIDDKEYMTPSFYQNLKYFFNYQLGYMYGRYLLWNYAGKTNDIQGFGEANNGQWQSGIHQIDKFLGINSAAYPQNSPNRGQTEYYAIPLLLILIGMVYQYIRERRGFIVLLAAFLMYSVGTVMYLNITPYQARERDYIFLASFMMAAIWLSMGAFAVSQWIANLLRLRLPRFLLPIFLVIPAWLLLQNFSYHNRSAQSTARNFAKSLLMSCAQDAILFTNGDNDSFPLFYLQNVEHFRTDVRVINISLLNSPDYIKQLKRKAYLSPPLHIFTSPLNYENPNPNYMVAARTLLAENPGEMSKKLNDFVIENDVNSLSSLMLMDILVSNFSVRPIYFSAYSNEEFLGLEQFLILEGLAYRLNDKPAAKKVKSLIEPKFGTVDAEKMYANYQHFSWAGFQLKNTPYTELERSILQFFADNMVLLSSFLFANAEYEKSAEVIFTFSKYVPPSIHYYPVSLGYMSVISSLLQKKISDEKLGAKAEEFMNRTLDFYKGYMQYYLQLDKSFAAQERLTAENVMLSWLTLCILAQDEELENARMMAVADFFQFAAPFVKLSYSHLQSMSSNKEFYSAEIERTAELVQEIIAFFQIYEEPILPPPASINKLF
ncbi:MAG: DUF2723 domain-containing protein [Bacteroidales bacterium]|jgi:MFS family permease|nr:DUF2723 domain-containing protein [Bacteroidales bacterium]